MSIVLPSRLTPERTIYIREAIASVLAQTYQKWELLIIDDHSEPPIGEILTLNDARIRIVRSEGDEGVSEARNTGLRIACGSLIALLDDDDLWLPEHLSCMVPIFQKHEDVAMVGGRLVYHHMEEERAAESHPPFSNSGYVTLKTMLEQGWTEPSAAVFRKDQAAQIGGFDPELRGYEWQDFWLRMVEQFPCYFVNTIVTRYRLHGTNMSQNDLIMGHSAIICWEKFLAKRSSGVDIRSIRQKLARQHYRVARAYAFQEQWGLAFRHTIRALRYKPDIGLAFVGAETRGWHQWYKVMKPYLAAVGLGLAVSPLGPVMRKWAKPR